MEPFEPLSLSRHPDGAILFALSEKLDWVTVYSPSAYPYQDDALFRKTTSLTPSSRVFRSLILDAQSIPSGPSMAWRRLRRATDANAVS